MIYFRRMISLFLTYLSERWAIGSRRSLLDSIFVM